MFLFPSFADRCEQQAEAECAQERAGDAREQVALPAIADLNCLAGEHVGEKKVPPQCVDAMTKATAAQSSSALG